MYITSENFSIMVSSLSHNHRLHAHDTQCTFSSYYPSDLDSGITNLNNPQDVLQQIYS